jgi:hypothetical protein
MYHTFSRVNEEVVKMEVIASFETHSTSNRIHSIQLPAKYFTFMEYVKGGKGLTTGSRY